MRTPAVHPAPITLTLLTLALCSCTIRPLKGGKATTSHNPNGGVEQTLIQGDNPAAPTRQDQETITVRTYTLPPGSRIEQTATPISPIGRIGPISPTTPLLHHSNTPFASILLSAPMLVTDREETRARTELGASQKDTARALAAKLSSLKNIVWVGVALFIFGLASLFWPPLKLVIGSITTSAAITLGGLALIILPTLVVGNELLLLGGVAIAVSAWFLAHRHGRLQGLLDANNNGIDDRLENSANPKS